MIAARRPDSQAYTPPDPMLRAPAYLTWHGREIFRAKGELRGSKLTCPDGHSIAGLALMHESHTFQCDHRAERPGPGQGRGGMCGALVWVRAYRVPGQDRRRYWAADITMDEVKLIERLALDPDAVVAYLGGGFHRERTG